MTLQEAVAAAKATTNLKLKRKKLRKTPAEREAELARIAGYTNPDQVLTFEQWRLLNSLSKATGQRILNSGPPVGLIVTELSVRRRGVTIGNNRIWNKSRSRG